MKYEAQAVGTTHLDLGKGISVQFKTDLLPPDELLAPVLKPVSGRGVSSLGCVKALLKSLQ
jgi:hypothetical protein